MKVNALVMSRSQASVRLLVAAFAELGIEYRIALSASEAVENLGSAALGPDPGFRSTAGGSGRARGTSLDRAPAAGSIRDDRRRDPNRRSFSGGREFCLV